MFFSQHPYADTSGLSALVILEYVQKEGTIYGRGSIFAVNLDQARRKFCDSAEECSLDKSP